MNIGFLTTRLFDTPQSGGELCTARLLQELARRGHRVHVVGRGPVPTAMQGASSCHTAGAWVPAFQAMSRRDQAVSMLGALASGQPSTVRRLCGGGAGRQVAEWLAAPGTPRLDAVWVDHLQTWPWIADGLAALPRPVVVMHNLESDGFAEQARAAGANDAPGRWLQQAALRREARLLRALEVSVLRHAGAVACLSEQDAIRLRQIAAACGAVGTAIHVLPGFPIGPRAMRADAPAQGSGPSRRIGLIGTWTWGPNRAALRWMLGRVLPRLPAHCTLVLAGTGLDARALPPRVTSLGRVDDVQAFYAQVDVMAIPSLHGSGAHEKVLEAFASGRPVVATPHALRGLEDDLPARVLVADEPAPFARHCADAPLQGTPADALDGWIDRRRRRYRAAVSQCLHASGASTRWTG